MIVPLLVGGFALLVVLGASAPNRTLQRSRIKLMDLAARTVDYVSRGESGGKYTAQNRNTDGAGLSFGIIQWTQRSGSLGKLLRAMYAVDPAAFARVFAPDSTTLLATTTSANEAVRMSLALWQEPWTSRFTAAGNHRRFQEVQAEAAKGGASWKAAMEIAGILNVWTERALILFFDRANHQGNNGAPAVARTLKADLVARGASSIPYQDLLRAYVVRCAAPYRRTTAPAQTTTPSGKVWKPVGKEWHLYAGKADLYAIIVRRTGEILTDPALSDAALELVS